MIFNYSKLNGKIVESGKHEELLEKGGIYADLVKYQLQ